MWARWGEDGFCSGSRCIIKGWNTGPQVPTKLAGDVALLPMLPEGFDVHVWCAALAQNPTERLVGSVAHADQRAEHVEGHELGMEGGGHSGVMIEKCAVFGRSG